MLVSGLVRCLHVGFEMFYIWTVRTGSSFCRYAVRELIGWLVGWSVAYLPDVKC